MPERLEAYLKLFLTGETATATRACLLDKACTSGSRNGRAPRAPLSVLSHVMQEERHSIPLDVDMIMQLVKRTNLSTQLVMLINKMVPAILGDE